jgi:hypothetical protein
MDVSKLAGADPEYAKVIHQHPMPAVGEVNSSTNPGWQNSFLHLDRHCLK